MDILAHALWTGAAGLGMRRRGITVSRRTMAAMVGVSLLPDVLPLVPVLAASVSQPEPFAFLREWVMAKPGTEPSMPPLLAALSHHLHCTMHSIVVLAAVTALAAWRWRAALLPLAALWLHVLIDIPTHSSEYYPVTILYPLSNSAFDGVAWTEPWLIAANYAVLAAVYAWLLVRPHRPAAAG